MIWKGKNNLTLIYIDSLLLLSIFQIKFVIYLNLKFSIKLLLKREIMDYLSKVLLKLDLGGRLGLIIKIVT